MSVCGEGFVDGMGVGVFGMGLLIDEGGEGVLMSRALGCGLSIGVSLAIVFASGEFLGVSTSFSDFA